MNGQAVREGGFEVAAHYGPAGAGECALEGLPVSGLIGCGEAAAELRIVAAGGARPFLGCESVHAHVTGTDPPA